jgi:hypothetical protein
MSLPAHERRALSAIDDGLRTGDPRLATMFAVFTELNQPEAMPPAEMVPAHRWWARGWWARAVRGRGRQSAGGWWAQAVCAAGGWWARAVHGAGPRSGGGPSAGGRRARGPRPAGGLSAVVILPLLLAVTLSVLIMSLVAAGSGSQRQCAHASPAVASAHWRGVTGCAPGPAQQAGVTTSR